MDRCTEFLKLELHESNAIGIYRFAEGHNIEGLRDIALAFIQVGHRQTEAVWAIRGWQGD